MFKLQKKKEESFPQRKHCTVCTRHAVIVEDTFRLGLMIMHVDIRNVCDLHTQHYHYI